MVVPIEQRQIESAAIADRALPARDLLLPANTNRRGDDFADALLAHVADLFLILNDDGSVRHASASAARVLGYTPEWLEGTSLAGVVHMDDASSLALLLTAPAGSDDQPSFVELRLRHGELGWRRFALERRDLRQEPAIGRVVLSLHDVTARRQAEHRNAAFLDLGQQLGAATTATAAARIIARVSDELLGWDAYYLSLYSREDDLLISVLSIDLIAGGAHRGARA